MTHTSTDADHRSGLPDVLRGFFNAHSIADLAAGLRDGRWTPSDLTERALDAITTMNHRVNAFVCLDNDRARADAARLGRELAAGVDRGLLHGIPAGIKDNIDVAGMPTTNGSVAGITHPDVDAACVSRLRTAGAVVIGKTVMHEFAYGATGDRSAHGPSRNPHNLALMTGGSSGGSAAAVASGMVPLALGTDTGGSVRVPAAFCAISGYKPPYAAIPTQGVRPLSQSLDHIGVLVRSAAEAITVGYILANGNTQLQHLDPAHPRTIGWLDPTLLCQIDDDVLSASYAAAKTMGYTEHIEPAQVHALLGTAAFHYGVISSSEAYANLRNVVDNDPESIDDDVVRRLRAGRAQPAWQYLESQNARKQLGQQVDRLFRRYDVLALPATPCSPPPLDDADTQEIGSEAAERRATLTTLTNPFNLTGHPTVVTTVRSPTSSTSTAVQIITHRAHLNYLWSITKQSEQRLNKFA